jgi:hypothetical protein
MSERTNYILQVLEKIGAPLMGAITDAAPADDPTAEAQTMAALLGKTVQASIDLGYTLETSAGQALDDSLRVALTALASPLVAGQYRRRASLPDDAALKKITSSLQAVLTFSENFAPNAENVVRLKDLEARGQLADQSQTLVQYVQAFIPVVEAIASFSFGQPEQKLITEVSDRLSKKSVEMRETLLPNLSEESEQKRAELGILKALALVYSAAHRAETDKAIKNGDEARMAGLSMEPVWRAFDLRATMLEALTGTMVPTSQGTSSKAPAAPAAAAPVQAAPPPIFTAPPAAPPPAAPPAAPPAGANPLSMFAKKDAEGAPPPPPVAPPPAAPPPEAQQPPPLPESPPPAAPPSSEGQGGGPMAFFKKSE